MPYAVLGPGYVLDDWFALANARFDGWWMAAGRDQWFARPGAGVVYAVVFGAVGRHPLVALAMSTGLVAAAAVLLRRLLVAVRLPDGMAAATAAVWLVLPNHGSLLYWASATNVTLALVALLGGLLALAQESERSGHCVVAAIALAVSALSYEATAPAAVLGLVVVPRLARRSWAWRPLAVGLAALVPAGAWMIAFFHPAKRGVGEWADLTLMIPAHAGWGVIAWEPLATVAGVAFAVGLAVTAVFVRPLGPGGSLAIAGAATIAVGTAPFVRYFYAPLGAGDRVNVVAAVGAAMAWTGLAWVAARFVRVPRAAVALGAILVAGALAEQWDAARAWSAAGDDAVEILRMLPTEGDEVAVAAPPVRRNVTAFLDRSNVEGAVQLVRGTRRVRANLVTPGG